MRHNYATNPSLETGTTGYATTGGVLTSGATLTNPAGGAVGTRQGHVAVTASGQGVSFTAAPAAPGRFKLLAQRPVDPDYKAFVLSKSPAFYLALDSTDGFTDLSGNGRNGTANGGVTAGSATGPHHRFNGVDTRTNMCVDPLFGAGSLARWSVFNSTAAIASTTLPTGLGGGTGNVCEVTPSSANGGIETYNSAVTPSGGVPAAAAAHRAGFWMKTDGTTQNMSIQFVCWNAGGTAFDTHTYTPSVTSAWTWVSTADVAQAGTTHIVVNIRASGTYVGTKFSFVGLMLEEGTAIAPTEAEHFPSAAQITASEARWTGTAHVSKSELAVQASGAAFFDGTDDRITTTYATRRNLCRNPSAEVDTAQWQTTAGFRINSGATLTREASAYGHGSYNFKVVTSGAADREGIDMVTVPVVAGTTYVMSAYIDTGGESWGMFVGDGTVGNTSAACTSSGMARKTLTFTPTGSGNTGFAFSATGGAVVSTARICYVMIEAVSAVGTYFPTTAQLASGEARWLGTADASGSELAVQASGATTFDGTDDRITTTYTTRRNMVPNPRFAVDTAGWSVAAGYHLNAGATITRTTPAVEQAGPYIASIVTTAASAAQGALIPFTGQTFYSGTAYTLRARVYEGTPSAVPIELVLGRSTADHATTTVTNNWSGWSDVSVTWTPATTVTDAVAALRTSLGSPAVATTIYVTGLICEAGTPGNYFDGSGQVASYGSTFVASTGESGWLGTAHASASDLGCFANGTSRTFMFWLNRDPAGYGTGRITLGNQLGGAGQYDVILQFSSTNATLYMGGTAAVTWSGLPAAGAYNHYMIVVDKTAVNRARLYVNGLLHTAETDISARSWYGGTTTQNLQVGRYAGSQYTYGKMGGVSVHYSALTATDAANAFASGRAEFILASGTTELGRAVAGTAWTQLDFPVSSGSQTLSIRTIAPRDFEFDAVQVGDDIDYRDGNHPGWEWTGTPDASTSQSLVGPDARHPILTIADYEAAIELAEQETTMTIENPTTTTEIET